MKTAICSLGLLLSVPEAARAEAPAATVQPSDSSHEGKMVFAIEFENPGGRTEVWYLEQSLTLRVGDRYVLREWRESERRLWNLRLFSEVSTEVRPDGEGVRLIVKLREKWTILPDVRFGSGGGTSYFRLGLYDFNLLGRGIEGLAAYEFRGGTHNGEIFARVPRVFGSQTLVGGWLARLKDVRTFYDAERRITGGATITRNISLLEAERVVAPRLLLGGRLENVSAKVGDDANDDVALRANRRNGFVPAGKRNHLLAGFRVSAGGFDYVGLHAQGFEWDFRYAMASRAVSSENVRRATTSLKGAWILPGEISLNGRALAGTTTSRSPELDFGIGGLGEVRGFYDGEFRGRSVWFGNLEARRNLFEKWGVVVQPALFMDGGSTSATLERLPESRAHTSVGGGVRFVSKSIHLVALRFDYAQTFSPQGGGLSFGLLQFF